MTRATETRKYTAASLLHSHACAYKILVPRVPVFNSCTREELWQTLTARFPNNPKMLDYLVSWPFWQWHTARD